MSDLVANANPTHTAVIVALATRIVQAESTATDLEITVGNQQEALQEQDAAIAGLLSVIDERNDTIAVAREVESHLRARIGALEAQVRNAEAHAFVPTDLELDAAREANHRGRNELEAIKFLRDWAHVHNARELKLHQCRALLRTTA